jgi:hypothetical protein
MFSRFGLFYQEKSGNPDLDELQPVASFVMIALSIKRCHCQRVDLNDVVCM